MSSLVTQITDSNFESEVIKSATPVLVDFWAAWCGPCKMLAPVVEGLAADYGPKLKVVKMNVDENPGTPGKYGIMGIPTLILFKDGQVAGKSVGYKPAGELKTFIDSKI